MLASTATSLLPAAPPPSSRRQHGGAALSSRPPPQLSKSRRSSVSHPITRSRSSSVRSSAISDLAELAPAASAVYGTLLFGGGLFAYARTKSTGSISGGISGAALMAVAYYLMQNPESRAAGEALGFGSAALFAAVFGIRLASTRKFMPSGLLLGISGASMAIFISAYLQDKI